MMSTGAVYDVPDSTSRIHEASEDILVAFREISDPRYLRQVKDVQDKPSKVDWKVENRLLYRLRNDPLLNPIDDREIGWKLLVPTEYRERVMQGALVIPSSGHLVREKTYDRIGREYYWKGMYHDVAKFVADE